VPKPELKELPISLLQRGVYQPRDQFDLEALKELAESIKAQGLIEPIVVRPVNAERYEIIAGERRMRAAKMADLVVVPCLINHYSDEQALAVTLIENIQRQDLTIIEQSRGYQRLIDEFSFAHEDIAKMVGKSRSHITNTLRLLQLDSALQKALDERALSMGHAKVLVGLSKATQRDLMHKVIKHEWSARRLEKEVQKIKKTVHSPKPDRDVSRLEALVSEACGSPVEIEQGDDSGGWLKIKFYDNDTLAGVLDKLKVDYGS
jgi:ParB family chromosome partitioning protein